MSLASADLPSDPDALRAFALACQSELAAATAELQAGRSLPRPLLMAGPFAFETENFRSRFVEERQAQSGFRRPAAAKTASPLPRRNLALYKRADSSRI